MESGNRLTLDQIAKISEQDEKTLRFECIKEFLEFSEEASNSKCLVFELVGEEIKNQIAQDIIKKLQIDTFSLKELYFFLTECSLENKVFSTFASILRNNDRLKKLVLEIDGCKKFDSDLVNLANELKTHGSHLDNFKLYLSSKMGAIDWNKVIATFAAVIASPDCPSYFELDVHGNSDITDECISTLFLSLKNIHPLKALNLNLKLNIAEINIGTLSMSALEVFLMGKTQPGSLEIRFGEDTFVDQIKKEDIKILADALKNSCSYQGRLSLYFYETDLSYSEGNFYDDESKVMLAEAAMQNLGLFIYGVNNEVIILCNARNELIKKYPEFQSLIVKFYDEKISKGKSHPAFGNTPFSLAHSCLFRQFNLNDDIIFQSLLKSNASIENTHTQLHSLLLELNIDAKDLPRLGLTRLKC